MVFSQCSPPNQAVHRPGDGKNAHHDGGAGTLSASEKGGKHGGTGVGSHERLAHPVNQKSTQE